MAKLTAGERSKLPDRAFAYIDAQGRRRLPIHDEPHVRNALGRFGRVAFEDDAARERARRRLLNAAKRFGIVPVGFITGQIHAERSSPDFSTFPTGTVTLFFTDIEGSTQLITILGDRYAALLKEARGIIGNAVRGRGGRTIDARADEHFAAFQRPDEAIQASIELQRAFSTTNWPNDLECRVRVGIHTGRPTLTEAGYVGLAVTTVARLCSAAAGGQILVSGRARAAVQGAPLAGVRFRSLGSHRLAGLARPESIYEVRADGLLSDFPPLRTG
jgi:class 3 adenylate cyclase